MATSATKSASSLALRTVHIKLHPTPRTFSERREVLRILEKYGEVDMFRSLKYHPKSPFPSSFLALFGSESAAKDLLSQSPIRYRTLPPTPPPEDTTHESATQEEVPESVFQLTASRTTFDHELFLNSPVTNPRHGPYTPQKQHTAISASLMFLIPKSITSEGMLDWEPFRTVEEHVLERGNTRVLREMPRVMKSPMALSRENQVEEDVD